MSEALVLAGGGAKGSFQIGALQYLYEKGYCANIICSTSVGSVNALQLAHGGTPPTQRAAFDTLKSIWETQLTFNEDMYDEAAWFKAVEAPARRLLVQLLNSGSHWESVAAAAAVGVFVFPPLAIESFVEFGELASDIGKVFDALGALKSASSVWTLEPTRSKINATLNPTAVRQSGVELRLVAASLDSGAIRYVTQNGDVLEVDGRPLLRGVCVSEREALNRARTAKDIASKKVKLAEEGRVATQAQVDLDEKTRALAQAQAAYDQCMARPPEDRPATRLNVKLVDGTIASSAIPCAFPPVQLGSEAYVDGGVRWQLPLQAAIDLHPAKIIAINTSLSGIQPAGSAFKDANLLGIAERASLGLELWETQESHWRAAKLQVEAKGQQLWMITPRVEVHDTFHIDPGLIDINIAYGYMCAADVLTALFPVVSPDEMETVGGSIGEVIGRPSTHLTRPPPTPVVDRWVDAAADPYQATLADGIALCRRRCWELEHQVFGYELASSPFDPKLQPVAPRGAVLKELRVLKTLLWLLVLARKVVNGPLPAGALTWGDNWERHRWTLADAPRAGATPWHAFAAALSGAHGTPGTGHAADPSKPPTVAAAAKPAGLLASAPDETEVWLIEEMKPYRRRVPRDARLTALGGPDAIKIVPHELLYSLATGPDVT